MVKKIIEFNHISNKISPKEIDKLSALYKTYHRLFKCYQWKYKKLRRLKLALELSSIGLTASGAIAGSITLNPIPLGVLSGSGILIQGFLTKSDLNKRVDRCRFAYTSYCKILIQLKSYLRGLSYDESNLLTDLKVIDDIIIDNCPSVDKYFKKYNEKFTD